MNKGMMLKVVGLGALSVDGNVLRRLSGSSLLRLDGEPLGLVQLALHGIEGGFRFGFRTVHGLLRVTQFLIQQIDLLLHHLVAVLQ